ncbi:hypothetical protein [Subtercola vilae]|uniref:Uncharacterized protein n=1 Tax=Subtercola vilae TaxID=2056433 RepID=A0A4T2BFR4_9MICO|nr:hypothetical protein [Subtercola vilae]TIH29489.1 hypothetical protein D4765_17900 [Subtercola vilae]
MSTMFIHPLVRRDQHLIQDFLLTKITLLLARQATASEWAFEVNSVREISGQYWADSNQLLLDYTLARVLFALHASEKVEGTDIFDDEPREESVHLFISAVGADDLSTAVMVWAAVEPAASQTNEMARDDFTTDLINAVGTLGRHRSLQGLSEHLPGQLHTDPTDPVAA